MAIAVLLRDISDLAKFDSIIFKATTAGLISVFFFYFVGGCYHVFPGASHNRFEHCIG